MTLRCNRCHRAMAGSTAYDGACACGGLIEVGEVVASVVNLRDEPYDVFIGRPSDWGNPFVIGLHGNREEVLALYRAWLLGRPDLIARARRELKGKVLGCYCAPLACHGDLLAAVADGAELEDLT